MDWKNFELILSSNLFVAQNENDSGMEDYFIV